MFNTTKSRFFRQNHHILNEICKTYIDYAYYITAIIQFQERFIKQKTFVTFTVNKGLHFIYIV